MIQSSLWSCTILYAIYQPRDIEFVDIISLWLLFIARICVIATKYAFFPESELKDLRKALHTHRQTERQVLTGWFFPSPTLVMSELKV